MKIENIRELGMGIRGGWVPETGPRGINDFRMNKL
jgi:hypothetical protein